MKFSVLVATELDRRIGSYFSFFLVSQLKYFLVGYIEVPTNAIVVCIKDILLLHALDRSVPVFATLNLVDPSIDYSAIGAR